MGAVDALRTRVRGEVIAPGDADYEEARKVYNGMIDKRPAAVVRCTGPDDVAAVVRWLNPKRSGTGADFEARDVYLPCSRTRAALDSGVHLRSGVTSVA